MFAKTYLDENVSLVVAAILRSRGFEIVTAQEAGNKGLSDDEQLNFAVNKKMAILTHDRGDYEELAKEFFDMGRAHYGIVIAPVRSPQIVAERLSSYYQRFTAEEITNQIIYI